MKLYKPTNKNRFLETTVSLIIIITDMLFSVNPIVFTTRHAETTEFDKCVDTERNELSYYVK